MEGRHCFGHLTIEENLRTGAYTRTDGKAAVEETLEKVYNYFPRLKTRRNSQAAYTSGGEQQMCAIGRALMAKPEAGAARRALDGPGAADRRRGVRDRQGSQHQGKGELPARRTEHHGRAALRRLRLHHGERPHRDGRRGQDLASNEDVKEFYLGLAGEGRKSFRDIKHYRRRKRWLS
jgi:branched-chain amino acid transport system ATP-binding protein